MWVKRDDKVGDGTTLPRWSKIEGIRKILESDYIDKSKPLNTFQYMEVEWLDSFICIVKIWN